MASREQLLNQNELLQYFKKHNITNFICKKNGAPDMRNNENKVHYQNMIRENNISNTKNKNLASDNNSQSTKLDHHNICPICYDEINNGKVELKCKHEFCLDCFTKFYLKKNTCPMCRDVFIEKKIDLMSDTYRHNLSSDSLKWRIFVTNDQHFKSYSDIVKINLENMNSKNLKETIKSMQECTKELLRVTTKIVQNHYEEQLFS